LTQPAVAKEAIEINDPVAEKKDAGRKPSQKSVKSKRSQKSGWSSRGRDKKEEKEDNPFYFIHPR